MWCVSPVNAVTPSRRRAHSAMSRQSSTSGVVMLVAARHPRMRRECASNTNATYTHPDHVHTYVKSATHSWFVRSRAKWRSTRSAGLVCLGSVSTGRLRLPRTTPAIPNSRMRRSTVQRAMSCPLRRNRSHSLRAPRTLRCSCHVARMIGFHRSSDTARGDWPRPLAS